MSPLVNSKRRPPAPDWPERCGRMLRHFPASRPRFTEQAGKYFEKSLIEVAVSVILGDPARTHSTVPAPDPALIVQELPRAETH